jgi:hypothetical protein
MALLPVEQTIGDTYRFVFRNILSIFGIAWLPMVLAAAALAGGFWTLWSDFAGLDWSSQADLAHNRELVERLILKVLGLALPLEIVVVLLLAMIAVGIQRSALGLIEGPVLVFFSLGGAVWRLFFGTLLAFLLIWISTVLTAIATSVLFRLGQHMAALFGLVEFAAVVASFCWFFYLAVRLTFFIPPAVVAEGGLGIERSWALGSGNFWRIVVIFLGCVVAPMIVVSIVSNAIVWPAMVMTMLHLQQATDAHETLPPEQVVALLVAAFGQILPIWIGIQLVTFPVVMGLSNAMSAFAYKHLTAPEAAA